MSPRARAQRRWRPGAGYQSIAAGSSVIICPSGEKTPRRQLLTSSPAPSGIPARSALPHNCKVAVLKPKVLPVAKTPTPHPIPKTFSPAGSPEDPRLSPLLVEHGALSWGPEEEAGDAFPSRSGVMKFGKAPTRDPVPWGWKGGSLKQRFPAVSCDPSSLYELLSAMASKGRPS